MSECAGAMRSLEKNPIAGRRTAKLLLSVRSFSVSSSASLPSNHARSAAESEGLFWTEDRNRKTGARVRRDHECLGELTCRRSLGGCRPPTTSSHRKEAQNAQISNSL